MIIPMERVRGNCRREFKVQEVTGEARRFSGAEASTLIITV